MSLKSQSKKYIFVTGGVISSLGKGIAASSLGSLLELRGFKIAFQKMDPYLNVDAGTMSPYQHGEVFVTEDGAETDLDIGNYERFTNAQLSAKSSVTTGQIYQSVIKKEREGAYLGKTVQVIPHITEEIKARIREVGEINNCDIVIIEIGGTIGDIESIPFLEAIRQFHHEEGPSNTVFVHVTMIPLVGGEGGELKTKPTQHSVRELRSIGIHPDIILCRTSIPLTADARSKIAMFCDVQKEDVINALNFEKTLYEIPTLYHKQELDTIVMKKLGIKSPKPIDLSQWKKIINIVNNPKNTVNLAVVGKYMQFNDAYKSLYEAIEHGAIANQIKVNISRLEADNFDISTINQYDGVIIPGGFGVRGTEAMIETIHQARIQNIPLLGICYGMQMMCIEYARNVLSIKDATSEEMNPQSDNFIISIMEEQKKLHNLGATMRLGTYQTDLMKGSIIESVYKADKIEERHRHRFEFNNEYLEPLKEKGLVFSGFFKDILVETIEYKNHPWAIGVQFHPELKSKPFKPHPIFEGLLKACLEKKN